jgi:hypothetical protein
MKTVTLAVAGMVLLGLSAHSTERLTMKVTPPVAMAPAGLVVRTTIEKNPENRVLEVIAQSPDYFRSSEMSLDGDRAPRTSEWVFRGLPAGRYEITATLIGPQGQLASSRRWFQAIVPSGQ